MRTRLVSLTALLGLLAAEAVAGVERAEIFDLFSQAKDLFRRANDLVATKPEEAKALYRQSALRLERIAEEGAVRNGQLYYNIGNVYFRLGDLGRAILWYRRAELFIPNDPNLQQNLRYARARRVDQIELEEKRRILKTLFFWHYDLAARTRLLLLVLASGAFWGLAALRLFRRSAGTAWGMVAVGMVGALMLASLVAESAAAAGRAPGVVVADEVVVRKGDAETYQPSFKEPLHAGTEFEVVEDRGEWLHIELTDGRRCWTPRKSIELVR